MVEPGRPRTLTCVGDSPTPEEVRRHSGLQSARSWTPSAGALHFLLERITLRLESKEELGCHRPLDHTGERPMHRLNLSKQGRAVRLGFQLAAPPAIDEESVPTQRSPTQPLVDNQLGNPIIDRPAFFALAGHRDLDLPADPHFPDGRGGIPIPPRVAVDVHEHFPDIVRRCVDGHEGFMTPQDLIRLLFTGENVSSRDGWARPRVTRYLAADGRMFAAEAYSARIPHS